MLSIEPVRFQSDQRFVTAAKKNILKYDFTETRLDEVV